MKTIDVSEVIPFLEKPNLSVRWDVAVHASSQTWINVDAVNEVIAIGA